LKYRKVGPPASRGPWNHRLCLITSRPLKKLTASFLWLGLLYAHKATSEAQRPFWGRATLKVVDQDGLDQGIPLNYSSWVFLREDCVWRTRIRKFCVSNISPFKPHAAFADFFWKMSSMLKTGTCLRVGTNCSTKPPREDTFFKSRKIEDVNHLTKWLFTRCLI